MPSRIPKPMPPKDLIEYRWQEKLPVIGSRTDDIPAHIFKGSTPAKLTLRMAKKKNHVFGRHRNDWKKKIINDVWGYGKGTRGKAHYPGPVLVAMENQPVSIKWKNDLPSKFPFVHPMSDLAAPGSMMGRYSVGHAAVHMHGARVEAHSDGYPMRTTGGGKKTILRRGEHETYQYPNEQPGVATLWYHDHAMDMTARNVYAGLAGGYILRHRNEGNPKNLPQLPYEIPLVIQDRSFTKDGKLLFGDAQYLNWRQPNSHSRAEQRDSSNQNFSSPSPEFKGHAICVNGKLWPTLEVEPRPYRFRIYNGANSRIFVLRISDETVSEIAIDPAIPGTLELAGDTAKTTSTIHMLQIGSDGGIFRKHVPLSGKYSTGCADTCNFLVIAPGERADVVIDFSKAKGKTLYLTNHAVEPAKPGNNRVPPYLSNGGDGVVDCSGARLNGFGLLADILKINVSKPLNTFQPLPDLSKIDECLGHLYPNAIDDSMPKNASRTRRFIINEFSVFFTQDDNNANHPSRGSWKAITFEAPDPCHLPAVIYSGKPGYLWGGKPNQPVDGIPNGGPAADTCDVGPISCSGNQADLAPIKKGSREKWEIFNLSGDVHPLHLHLVNFKVSSRAELAQSVIDQIAAGDQDINLIAPTPSPLAVPQGGDNPGIDQNEMGWKDTVRANPNQCITLDVFFDANSSQRKDYSGDFVWHCHLIDHEDMGMMRPLTVDEK